MCTLSSYKKKEKKGRKKRKEKKHKVPRYSTTMGDMTIKFEFARTTLLVTLLEKKLSEKGVSVTLLLYLVQQLLANSTRVVRDADITWREAANYIAAALAVMRLNKTPTGAVTTLTVADMFANIPDLSGIRTVGGGSDNAIRDAYYTKLSGVVDALGDLRRDDPNEIYRMLVHVFREP